MSACDLAVNVPDGGVTGGLKSCAGKRAKEVQKFVVLLIHSFLLYFPFSVHLALVADEELILIVWSNQLPSIPHLFGLY